MLFGSLDSDPLVFRCKQSYQGRESLRRQDHKINVRNGNVGSTTSPDLHAGVWAGVEAGEDGEVGVLVQGGHHHPEHEDQQTRAPLHIAHPCSTAPYTLTRSFGCYMLRNLC